MKKYSKSTQLKHDFYKFIGLSTNNVSSQSNKGLDKMHFILHRKHGLNIVDFSDWHCSIERDGKPFAAIEIQNESVTNIVLL